MREGTVSVLGVAQRQKVSILILRGSERNHGSAIGVLQFNPLAGFLLSIHGLAGLYPCQNMWLADTCPLCRPFAPASRRSIRTGRR